MSAIVAGVISSGLISTILTLIVNQINRAQDKRSGANEAMRLVMKDRLRHLCRKYIDQGWIYEDELEDIFAMHRCYHDTLKGNGYLDSMMDRIKHLEVRGAGH